ncbi:hypothetical protein TNCV_2925001 [Trichonephila clavipes]|nr:hypothetical protein TNCV_2925001 [Trichonephila clavipes]
MVSPAGQGQERHPSIVPGLLVINQLGVTSARGHGAIVYCLNSGSGGGRRVAIMDFGAPLDNRQSVSQNNHGQEKPQREEKGRRRPERERKRRTRKGPRKSRKKGQESPGERDSEARLEWRKRAESEIGVKKTMNAGGVEYGNMN